MINDYERIEHILEAINKMQKMLADINYDSFEKSFILQDATLYNFTIIGEAARGTSDKLQEQNPEIPWGSMIGMRNVIIHDYVKTNLTFVWKTIVDDLPILKQQLVELLTKL